MKYVIVSGYGYSGSGAVVDLLKEFDNVSVPNIEFRLIKDPYGISQLEEILINKWDEVNAATAIDDFLWLCRKCNRESNRFYQPFGLNYSRILTPDFYLITESYIKKITEFEYETGNFHKEFKKNYIISSYDRLLDAISRHTNSKIRIPYHESLSYFGRPSKTEFENETRKYLNKIFSKYNQSDYVVLDQAVSPLHSEDLKYFDDAKMVVVDRNPADIFVDLLKNRSLIGKDREIVKNPDIYINWYKKTREVNAFEGNVLKLRFEDVVYQYDICVDKICDFLGLEMKHHLNIKKYFDPNISRRNINMRINNVCSTDVYDYISNILN